MWKAAAIGHGNKAATLINFWKSTELLEKKFKDEISHDEGVRLAIEALFYINF